MNKNNIGPRSHYMTVKFLIYDASAEKELIVALGAATGGGPHHRIDGRYLDLSAIGCDVENKAGI